MNAINPSPLKPDNRRKPGSKSDKIVNVHLEIEPEETQEQPAAAGSTGTAAQKAAGKGRKAAAASAGMAANETIAETPGETPAETPREIPGETAAEIPGETLAGGRASQPAGSARRVSAVPAQLASIEVLLSVEVGSHRLPLRELLEVEAGQLFTLDRLTSEPVTVMVNGQPFAAGEIVAIGDRFGVRLLDILPGDD